MSDVLAGAMRGIAQWAADREAMRHAEQTLIDQLLVLRDEAAKNAPRHFSDMLPSDAAIPLLGGPGDLVSVVEEEDFEFLASMRWIARERPDDNGWTAMQDIPPYWGMAGTLMHRIVMRCFDPALDVDHKNGNALDNRRRNLRICTRQQNLWNRRKRKGRCLFKGVHVDKHRRYSAQIRVDGKQVRLGSFGSEIDAATAYDDAARLHFGEYACVNFPRDGEQGALDASVLDALKHHAGEGACLPASCGAPE